MFTRFIMIVLFAVLLGSIVGCSDGPKIVKVSGTAFYKGEPVSNLRITFQPDKGRPSWGDTDAKGRFTLEYDANNKGALLGMHTVSAIFQAGTPDDEMKAASEGPKSKIGVAARAVQAKYGHSLDSPLRIEITEATDKLEVRFD
jgi:hypothetical protein